MSQIGNRWFSLGIRSTGNIFSDDGGGIGTGGHFRIQLSRRVNTEWFADYISTRPGSEILSIYYHIGWSVIYYLTLEKNSYPAFQFYVLAGHCFDYNRKEATRNPKLFMGRWGSAIQGGMGAHFHVSPRINLTLCLQYMTHLTSPIDYEKQGEQITFFRKEGFAREGHLLTTLSMNYRIFKIWQKN